MPVKKPIFSSVVINAATATVSIGAHISNFSYTEIWGAAASHFEFDLADSASIKPTIGDYLEIKFKYADDPAANLVNTGTMRVDDTVRRYDYPLLSIGANAFDYNLGNRIPISYTNASIRAIVETQSSVFGLSLPDLNTISGAIAGTSTNVTDPKVEKAESRAEMLALLARKYGYFFNLYLGQLIFRDISILESQPAARVLTKSDVCNDVVPQSRKTTSGNFKNVQVSYNNNGSAATGVYTATADDGALTNNTINLSSEGYYNNFDSASRRGYGQIKESNRNWNRMSISCEGHYLLRVGNVVQLADFYPDYGFWLIEQAVHTIRKSDGWRTQLDLRYISL
ncbi:MAG: hypothetical protein HC862_02850 [Scytonema sp. RU_4_4]|nr:hypothetical protein [Scytonema sp. RU_4_4]